MTTPTTGHRTHVGLGELADITASHAVKSTKLLGFGHQTLTCECGQEFDGYSEHAFHLATEAVAYADGRTLDPLAMFDRKYGDTHD